MVTHQYSQRFVRPHPGIRQRCSGRRDQPIAAGAILPSVRHDQHSDEAGDAYLVVDTGVWIFGKEILLPASTVVRIDPEDRKLLLDRTREQVKAAPEFHRDKHLGDAGYREQLGTYYGTGAPFGGWPA
ncbi:hypothetical protein [Streptomyces sp. DSM 40907]|uniref:hypothetical protein n=1 Tax=Streptomyces kutzneri TaxID=3051179 RepID=UPI0028D70846|nr:hypothetical protein [Streptomyces sp. DSM 40907]